MEALQLLHLRLVDGYVHPTFLLLNHLYRKSDRLYGYARLNPSTGRPAPRCYLPACQPRLSNAKLANIRTFHCQTASYFGGF